MNLKKNTRYLIHEKGKPQMTATFDRIESVKYLRFKGNNGAPILVAKKNTSFSQLNGTRRNRSRSPNNSRRNTRKRAEFSPVRVHTTN